MTFFFLNLLFQKYYQCEKQFFLSNVRPDLSQQFSNVVRRGNQSLLEQTASLNFKYQVAIVITVFIFFYRNTDEYFLVINSATLILQLKVMDIEQSKGCIYDSIIIYDG